MLKRILVALTLVALGTSAQAGPVGPEFQVNTYQSDGQEFSAVAPLANGGFVVVWRSAENGYSYGIFGQVYDAAGSRVGAEFEVNKYRLSQHYAPSVAGLVDGGFVITWTSRERDGFWDDAYGRRYNADGTPKGGEFRINAPTYGYQRFPSIAGLADGGFVVVWFSSEGTLRPSIMGQRFRSTGARAGASFKVATALQDEFGYSPPFVGKLANGGFVVTWNSKTSKLFGVYARRYDATGAPAGPTLTIAAISTRQSRGLTDPQIAGLKNGSFVVVWNDFNNTQVKAGTFGQRYTPRGAAFNAKFKINTTPRSHHSAVSALADGGFVVTFVAETENYRPGLFGQRYTANGSRSGAQFGVRTPQPGAGQPDPSVAGLPNGGFVVTWTDREPVFENFDGIYGQRFNP
jgi:hypothetical protein